MPEPSESYDTADESLVAELAPSLDLSNLPPIFVLSAHISTDDLVAVENALTACNAPLTYAAAEAQIFLGKVAQKRRAVVELRQLKVTSEDVDDAVKDAAELSAQMLEGGEEPPRKRQKTNEQENPPITVIDDSSTESELEAESEPRKMPERVQHDLTEVAFPSQSTLDLSAIEPENYFRVVKLAWFNDSTKAGQALPLDEYTVYRGRRTKPAKASSTRAADQKLPTPSTILSRAKADKPPERSSPKVSRHQPRVTSHKPTRPSLLHETTSEHDTTSIRSLPPLPDWALRKSTYSCDRATLANPPNAAFIAQLITIRKARKLTGDEIGVRAYSTAIASLAAYPHAITTSREVLALPGCEGKIAALWSEWRNKNGPDSRSSRATSPGAGGTTTPNSGTARLLAGQVLIDAAREVQDDPKLAVLRLFYDIWGVGATTARSLYDAGRRDLDDVVEFEWGNLSRVQQIGVKYYDEFLEKMSRKQVEDIAAIIDAAAKGVVRDPDGIRTTLVGGYRRGKEQSGDVDVIVSHVDEEETLDLVPRVVAALVAQGWITHELSASNAGTRRGQAPKPARPGGGGHGFDSLDKALVVWQDPSFPQSSALSADDRRRKNPNVHRRVDIIVAPWRRIGCAVLGWTAGTTFERDLRRWAKKEKGWKFDSGGVTDRASGREVDLQGEGCENVEEAERRVFEGLGLIYREPWERCTN